MRELAIKFLMVTKMEWLAPVSGGSVGIFAWAVKLAPLISILAAIIGVILGVMSYRLKHKQAMMEMHYLRQKTNQLNKDK